MSGNHGALHAPYEQNSCTGKCLSSAEPCFNSTVLAKTVEKLVADGDGVVEGGYGVLIIVFGEREGF